MTNAVIFFFIGLGCYLLGLVVYVIVKHIRNKRKYKKELEAKKNEEAQDHDCNA